MSGRCSSRASGSLALLSFRCDVIVAPSDVDRDDVSYPGQQVLKWAPTFQLATDHKRSEFLVTSTLTARLRFADIPQAVEPELMRRMHEVAACGRVLPVPKPDACLFCNHEAVCASGTKCHAW